MPEHPTAATPDALDGPPSDVPTDLFFTFDEDDRLRGWNRAVVRVTGHDDETLSSMRPVDLFEPEAAERIAATMADVFETGLGRAEVSLVTGDGERIPYELRAVRITDASGETQGFCGSARDITDRRAVERERQAVLDRMTDAFFAVDTEWRLTYVNDRAADILSAAMGRDLPADSMDGLDLWEEIPDAVRTTFYGKYHEAMRTQEVVSFREQYYPLRAWFDVQAYPSETGLSVFFRDVTEQQRYRNRLESRERVLRELYDVVSDVERSFDEQVETLMEIGRGVLGTEYAALSRIEGETYVFEMVEAPNGELGSGDTVPFSSTFCERAVTTERTLVVEDAATDAPGLARRVAAAGWDVACYLGAPVFVEGEVYGTFCFYGADPPPDPFSEWQVTLVDLMAQWVSYELERQRANERLARKNQRLEEFASIVSHDLRNPLNVLQGSLDLAERTGDPEQFGVCRRAADRMEGLIDDVLTLARQGETVAETRSVPLAGLVETCWVGVETGGADLRLRADRSVRADESRLQQAFENLFHNAVEHGPRGVTITVGDLDDGFYVEDDGPGIPSEKRERVLESGYSTSETGTGFGLAIVRRIVEAHGWTIDVTESDEGGARFEVRGVESG